jgi:hypothetical protein
MVDDMDTHSRYPTARYTNAFETWTDALHAADVDADQRVIDDIRRVADHVDDVPTVGDISTHSHYTPTTLGEHFGSFDAAIAAAGVHDPTRSRTPTTDTDSEPAGTNSNTATHDSDTTTKTSEPSSSSTESETTPTNNPDTAGSNEDEKISSDGIIGDIMTDFDDLEEFNS